MNTWNIIASVVGAVGGIIGIVFGALGIRYARAGHLRSSEAHDILLERFRREEEQRTVDGRKDHLLRLAYEVAHGADSASTLSHVTLTLESELDHKAAWELVKDEQATVEGDKCTIAVNKLPPGLRGLP